MVKLRKYRRRGVLTGEWEVNVRVELASGAVYRERAVYRDSTSKVEARTFGEEREHEVKALARQGLDLAASRRALKGEEVTPPNTKSAPTLAAFAPTFIEHAKANRQKASTIYAKESVLRKHLVPVLGAKRLDEITALDIQALKVRLAHRKPKTANNVLAVLSKLLRVAKRLGEIKALPIESVELLKVSQATVVISAKVMRGWMKSARRLAGLKVTGNFHVLRHTFCSHLAMKGAPAKSNRSPWDVSTSRPACSVDARYAVPVSRAKQILLVVGICVAGIGVMALPFPRTSPKALTQSLFERVAMTGAFTQPGLILIFVGLGCLAVAALLPSGRR